MKMEFTAPTGVAQLLKEIAGTPFTKFAALNPDSALTAEERQAAFDRMQARTNPSTGPTTLQGKLRSSLNARKHGYAGASLVIEEQDRPAYEAHLDHYYRAFKPKNQPQADAIRLAANALWRMDQLTVIETCLLDLESGWTSVFTDARIQSLSRGHHLAIGFLQHTGSSHAVELCRRYQSSAARDYQRAVQIFNQLKEITEPVAETPEEDRADSTAKAAQPNELPQNEPPKPLRKPVTPESKEYRPTKEGQI